ncbi:M48 family metalloprotease [Massilia norwichensis]|uniref:M48 family metalloprotease n=1 Tax=Massilia norwichensis TaxID=1442366 RepID=A0ABT2A8X6_9BURK|nr:M48 family metalloprotease [Massilia norwichensis]MCS0590547.1 M48 family metalloprotease [Massilia norwichensis]
MLQLSPLRTATPRRLHSLLTAIALAASATCALAAPTTPVTQSASVLRTPDATLPTLGDAARADLSPVIERKLGEEIMNDIRRDRDYLDDDAIVEYLNNFGENLVTYAPGARGETNADFFFFAVRDPMINAFALPGGFIGVHSQLLIAAQSESELASVLSHEIGHVQQRHIARMLGQQKQDALLPLAALILAALVGKAGGGADAAMGVVMGGQGLAIQRQLNFSREAEREADRVGFQTMRAAGYDTSGMVSFFKRLQGTTRLYGEAPAWLSSHPLTGERIADIQNRIREAPKPGRIKPDSIEFHLVRARARVLQDPSAKGREEARSAFETQLKQDNTQEQTGAMYGLSFLALKEGDLKTAQSWLEKAKGSMKPKPGVLSAERTGSDGSAMFASLGVEIKLAPGQPPEVLAQAEQEASQAHQKFPLSRMLARQYADAMIASGKLDQAAAFLRDQVQQYREEPKLYDQLAKAYAAQGKIALQHMALAESYVLSGALPAAVDQLNMARKAKDVSFYDQAVIDARERDLQQRQKDEKQEKKDRGDNWAAGQNGGAKLKVETSSDTMSNSRLGTAPGFGNDTRSGFESLDAFEKRIQGRAR